MIGISEELKNTDPDLLSPLTLAFIGDTVFDLLVRGNLVMQANRPVGKLHPLAAKRVCAAAQARAAQVIAPVLTEHEPISIGAAETHIPAEYPRAQAPPNITAQLVSKRCSAGSTSAGRIRGLKNCLNIFPMPKRLTR